MKVLEEDAYGMRLLVENLPEVIVAASCSKNFGLYRERVGLAAIITEDSATRKIAQGQIQSIARGIYSMPPSYGGALVDIILADEALNNEWVSEVNEMRDRMKSLRAMLVQNLHDNGSPKDFSFVNAKKVCSRSCVLHLSKCAKCVKSTVCILLILAA